MKNWYPKSVRSKLAIIYSVTIMCLIALYSSSLYYLYWKNTYSDFDRQLRGDIETLEMALEHQNGQTHLIQLQSDPSNWISEIWDSSGKRVFSTSGTENRPLGQISNSHSTQAENKTLADGLKVRALVLKSEAYPEKYTLRVARLTERATIQLSHFLSTMLLGVPLVVLAAGLTGYFLARKTLAPMTLIVEKAKAISADKLSERLPVENPADELGQLATTFNDTFERLEKSFDQMKRFSSDASHELRTPLAAIRALGEVSLRSNNDVAYYQDTISNILEETARLQNLCENLLLLSKADSGVLPMTLQTVQAQNMAKDVVQILEVLAEEKDQTLSLNIPDELQLAVDPHFFRQVLLNLVDNSIKYCDRNAHIEIWGKSSNSSNMIGVKDDGPGISVENQRRVFDRFFRVDTARSRTVEGSGLGLSISSWIVQSHGGSIEIESDMGHGSNFVIHLPKEKTS